MLKVVLSFVPLMFLVAACNPAQGFCQKEFDCKDDLGLDLQDDFVAVCTAELEGENNALRQNAEKPCKDLADAEAAKATCLSTLSCDDLKKAVGGEDTICKSVVDDFDTKLEAANGGLDCNGVNEPAAEGEGAAGEGEGEGQ